ncbi:Stk1 family PASTA domain-containing Ser/Thr kinase, partial [Georgenia sp. 10Sc9-8]|nr:Stk1 family PASTA domain-containing Ser/Thr kinase [Georgenia halotolerans]
MDEVPHVLAGRYEVGELIGRGGMAEVHIGYDNRLSRTVAIKVLRADLARDPTFHARFRREAQSAAALNHPAIVAVYDTGEEQVATNAGHTTVPFIVMEYVEGHTVRELLDGGDPVPIDEAVDIIVGVLGALEYSHREGIVHRDIKPGNIMLTPTGAVKVMDFGIARAMADSGATMTQTHAVVGTAQYLSPEQARGEVVDARSDLYSTGCLLYELLTGQPLFSGDSAVAVAYQHVRETPKAPSVVTPDVPEALDRVALKALAKDREERYADAAHMRTDLLAAARGERVEAPPTAVWGAAAGAGSGATQVMSSSQATRAMSAAPERTSVRERRVEDPQPRSRWWVWVLVVIGLLAAAGIAVLALDLGSDDSPATEMVQVPDMTDMDQVEAAATLEEEGLLLNRVDDVTSDDVEEGLFVESDPPAGEEVEVGETVDVAFSAGPEDVALPDLSGLTQEQARGELDRLDLDVGTVEEVDEPDESAGRVIRTDPAAGTELEPGDTVRLEIASGNVELPDLRGEPLDAAQQTLRELNLFLSEVTDQESEDVEPGTVVDQSAEGLLAQGDEVTLTVAVAPEEANGTDGGEDGGTDGNGDTDGGGG